MLKLLKTKVYSWAIQKLSNYWFSRLLQISQQFKIWTMQKDIGHNTFVDKTAQVNGWQSIAIGHSSILSEDVWLNVNVRQEGTKHIIIGNNCYIGKRSFLTPAYQILIGDYCMTSLDCRFLGSNHIFNDPLSPYLTTGTTSEGIIKLECNVMLGAGVTILGNVTIGRGSIIGAGSIVTSNIPPFSVAFGTPCRIIKRYDFQDLKWVNVKDHCIDRDRLMPGEAEYLEILNKKCPKIHFSLQAASRDFGHMV